MQYESTMVVVAASIVYLLSSSPKHTIYIFSVVTSFKPNTQLNHIILQVLVVTFRFNLHHQPLSSTHIVQLLPHCCSSVASIERRPDTLQKPPTEPPPWLPVLDTTFSLANWVEKDLTTGLLPSYTLLRRTVLQQKLLGRKPLLLNHVQHDLVPRLLPRLW